MSDDYPRSRDPLDIMIWKESRSCKNCKHEMDAIWLGEKHRLCGLMRKHGVRCKRYVEKGKE